MRNLNTLLWVVFTCLPSLSIAQLALWNGSVSSNWNTPANWTPSGVPNSISAFVIIFSGSPNLPVTLSSNVQVGTIVMVGSVSLNLGGNKIEIHDAVGFSSATLTNGGIEQRGDGTISFTNSLFTNIAIEKHGSGSITGNGGNTFNGTTVFEAKSTGSGSFQVGNSTMAGNNYTGPLEIRNQSNTVNLTVGAFSTHTLAAGLKLFNTGGGSITLGSTMGSLAVTGAIDGTGNTAGSVNLNAVTQSGGAANNLGNPASLVLSACTFSGDFSCTALTSLSVLNSALNGTGTNTLASSSIDNIQSSIIGGPGSSNLIHKLSPSGLANSWSGGNTFRNVTVRNSSASDLTLAGSSGDSYLGDARFENLGSGLMRIALFGTNTFSADLILQNTSSQGIQVGAASAPHFTTIAGNFKNAGFTTGLLELRRLEQQASTANDPFSPLTFRASSAIIRGNFSCTLVSNITALENSTFSRSNAFSAGRIQGVSGSTFSDLGGMTTFTKTGGTDDNWPGNNTFHTVEISNTSGAALRLANTASSPDLFLKKATFKALSGALIPCNTSNCHFRDTISTLGTSIPITFGGVTTGNMIIDGNKTQVLLGGASARRLVMSTTGKLELQSTLNILNLSTFNNGVVYSTSTNLLIYASTASSPTGSNMSHVDGPVRRSGDGNFRYPVGNNGKYAFVEITDNEMSDVFTVQYFNTAYVSTAVDATLDHVSECEYWQIDRTGSSSQVTLSISWDNVRSCGVDNLANLKLARWTGMEWTNIGGMATGGPASGTIAVTNFNTFSTFTLASLSPAFNPLPIELIHFTAKPNGKVVDLTWATATEKDNDYFTVERSRDGIRFDPVRRVPGAGTTSEPRHYFETDENPLPGTSYYRLRQTDFDGAFTFSDVAAVRISLDDKTFAIFPNPAADHFVLETGADPAQLRYRLLNSMGQTMPLAPAIETGRLRFSTQGLTPGLYFLEVHYQNAVQSLKVMVR